MYLAGNYVGGDSWLKRVQQNCERTACLRRGGFASAAGLRLRGLVQGSWITGLLMSCQSAGVPADLKSSQSQTQQHEIIEFVSLYMYVVCMHRMLACRWVGVYANKYVCNACMHACIHDCMYVCLDGWMDACMHACVCMHERN